MAVMHIMLDDDAYEPVHAHEADAGYDLRTPVEVTVPAHGSAVINTRIHTEIPDGCVGILKAKSGLNIKHGIIGTGTVDAGYTGAIIVKLYNMSDEDYTFAKGDKLIQLVILPILRPELELSESFELTERGSAGFGSTGR